MHLNPPQLLFSNPRSPFGSPVAGRGRVAGPPLGSGRSEACATPAHDWPSLRAPVAALLHHAPFSGRAAIDRVRVHAPRPGLSVLACVPARDEEGTLARTLDALAASLAGLDEPAGILLMVNNTSDATADAAWEWARHRSLTVAVCEAQLAPAIANAGHARRLALDLAALLVRPNAVLLSTDADTRVARPWARRLVGAVRAGAGLAAGMIDVEPAEFAALPERVREVERVERALFREHERLWRLLVPDEPLALGLRVGGASMAISVPAYRRVGGLPAIASSEDRAMVARMIAHGERIVFDAKASIRTSCRLVGRATGGMAGMLERRIREADPPCDQALMTADRLAALCLAWRHIRGENQDEGDGRTVVRLAAVLGCRPSGLAAALTPTGRGRAWTALLDALGATPVLRASEVAREVDRSRALRRSLLATGGTERYGGMDVGTALDVLSSRRHRVSGIGPRPVREAMRDTPDEAMCEATETTHA